MSVACLRLQEREQEKKVKEEKTEGCASLRTERKCK
jgi:hypothetical protein